MDEENVRMAPEGGILHWEKVERYLKAELQRTYSLMENAVEPETYRLAGEARRIKKMLNLPSALYIKEEQERGEGI